MKRQQDRPTLNMDLIKNMHIKMDQSFLTQGSPSYLSAKRRKIKQNSNRKASQDVIKQSHQNLMRYVDTVDIRVQQIIRTYQGQFLGAYKNHIKKVRQEMQQIRRLSLNNSSSQKAYLQKIDCLQKQLIIFRDQSLKLFNKISNKDKQIFDLNLKIKMLQSDIQSQEKNIIFLTKRNKQLQAFITKNKVQSEQKIFVHSLSNTKQIKNENARYEVSTPNSKKYIRPSTSAKISNSSSLYLRVQSNKKSQNSLDMNKIRQKLQQQAGSSKLVNIDSVVKIIEQKDDNTAIKSNNSSINPRHLYSKQKRRSSIQIIQSQITKLKSQELASRNQYLNIFKNCVEEVKKDIVRKNNMPSLNYFKENGPKNYIDFKKMHHYSILQLMIKNDQVLKKIYQIIFGSK